jgi:general secretion pathway protein D
LLSPFEQIEKEVVVVPEPVSNSLIVSATPRYFEEIRKLVEEIDARPPMVLIQVLIAEVALNNTDEFGAEIGLQDSVLFDRSLLGDLVTITNSTQQAVAGGGTITTQNQNVVAATNNPGFAFNNAPIGNSGSNNALAKANVIGSQGLSSFAVGRTNADLGFGGLVLSASSESVSVLIRALQESRRLDVLSRPQVMTLDNQAAFVQVGARVPRVQGVTINATGQVNNVVDVNVGLILGVTPRISPDGLVVMEIDAEKSALGPEAEGVPISIAANGDVVRQPVINTTTAQTTISAMNGQTVVLGGLITKTRAQTHRRVPILSSIPILGNLFRYDLEASERTELLIIMTPHVVRNDDDVTRLRQIETSRMSWVLGDVKKLHGTAGFGGYDVLADEETLVIYPDQTPGAEQIPVGKPAGTVPPQPIQTEQQDAVDLSVPRNTTTPNLRIPGTAAPGTVLPNTAPPNPAPPPRGSEPGPLPQSDDSSTNPLRGPVPIGTELTDDELLPTTVSYGAPPTPRGASIIPVAPPANANRAPVPGLNESSTRLPDYSPQPYGQPNFVPQTASPQAYTQPTYGQPVYGSPAEGAGPYVGAGQVVPVGYVAPAQTGVSYGNPYGTSSGAPVVPASTGVGP